MRYAVGDVHGCRRTLKKMLNDVLQLKPFDTLYLLGDYIDSGVYRNPQEDYGMAVITYCNVVTREIWQA